MLGGRYRTGGRLGVGGTADVYEATDMRLGRRVAVKVSVGWLRDDELAGRFQEEARLLGALGHPRLVPLYDAGVEGGHAFLVMPLVAGPTLAGMIRRGPCDSADVRRIGMAVAEALAYIHALGVVHRDVKPSNVLLDRRGGVFLADFGIAHAPDGPDLTATNCVIGTAGYFAPEQAMGRSASPASDVYALGLSLLEALTGRPEYTGTPLERAVAAVTRPPCIPRTLGSAWRAVLELLTASDPDSRPRTHEVRSMLAEDVAVSH